MHNSTTKRLATALSAACMLLASFGLQAAAPSSNGDLIANQVHNDGDTVSVDVSVAFTANDTPITEFYVYPFSQWTLPAGLSFNANTGIISGTLGNTASQRDVGLGDGKSSIAALAMSADGNSNYASRNTGSPTWPSWTISNVAPVAAADSAEGFEDETSITGNVISNDTDGGNDTDTLTVTGAVDTPRAGNYGTLTVDTDGGFTYVINNANAAVQALYVGQTLTDTFAYTANDGQGGTDNANLTLTIKGKSEAPVLTVTNLTATEDGTPVSALSTFTDSDLGETHSYTVSTLAAGQGSVTINASSGLYTFMPGADFQSLSKDATTTVSFNVTVTDSENTADTKTVTVTVTGVNDDSVMTVTDITTTEDAAASITAGFTDVDSADVAAFTVTAMPAGQGSVSIGAATGVYTYDPGTDFQSLPAGATANVQFNVSVSDGNGFFGTQTVNVLVNGVNDPAVLTVSNLATIEDGAAVSATPSYTDVDTGDTHTYTVSALGTGQGSVAIDPSTGKYTFDPGADFQSVAKNATTTVNFGVTVTDNNGDADTESVTVTVTGVNDDSVLTVTDITTTEDATASITAGFADVDSTDVAAYTVSAVPAGQGSVSIDAATGVYTFDPGADFQSLTGSTSASVQFNVSVSDGNGFTDSKTVNVTVTGVNDAPVLAVTNLDAVEDGPAVTATPTSSDIDNGATKSYSVSGLAANQGSVSIDSATGAYSFSPGPDFQSLALGATAVATFDVIVTDNQSATDTKSVNVNVTGVNDAPEITVADLVAIEDGPVVQSTPVFSDIDTGDTRTFTVTAVSVGQGSVTIDASSGRYSFSPGADFQSLSENIGAVVTFDVTATDNNGASDTKTVTVTVAGVNDDPVINDAIVNLEENSAAGTVVLNLGATDIDVDDIDFDFAIIAGLTSFPAEFTVNPNGDIVVGVSTPDVELLNFEVNTQYILTLQVSDDFGAIGTAEITINLTGAPDAPGVTFCEEYDGDGNSLNTLQAELSPLLNYYDFSAATPCHRVILQTDDFYMEEEKTLVAQNPLTSSDTNQKNYRLALSQIPAKTWDEDADTVIADLVFSVRRLPGAEEVSGSALGANVQFTDEAGNTTTDGSFIYIPFAGINVTDNGQDNFVYRVCDDGDETTESEADCAYGVVYVSIAKTPITPVSTDNVIVGSELLARKPLELPAPALPNIFLLLDDSGSMGSDIISDDPSGYYSYTERIEYESCRGRGRRRTCETRFYNRNRRDEGFLPNYIFGSYAPSERKIPGVGLWRLRTAAFNKIYYNPNLTYSPWQGIDDSGDEYTNAPITNARSDPYNSRSRTVNLTRNQNMPNESVYIPKYYSWTDINRGSCPDNVRDVVDGTSPFTNPGGQCTEGTLVEIRDNGTEYYKGPARTDCVDDFCTYGEEIQNFANFYSYSRNRTLTAKTSVSAAVAASENMRIGFGAFNSTNNNLIIKEMNESPLTANKSAVLQRIQRLRASGSTPIRRSLDRTGRYYECLNNNIIRNHDPVNNSGDNCPVLPAPEGNCQQNFALIVTDGIWSGSNFSASSMNNNDRDGTGPWDGGRYADGRSQTLADVAMYYYERDLYPNLDDEVPANERDVAGAPPTAFANLVNPTMHQHMSTFVITFGIDGTVKESDIPTDITEPVNWGSPTNDDGKLNDMLHASLNGRGQYLSAGNTEALTAALTNTFDAFSQAIGTASAVSFNSQEIVADSLVYRAFYNIRENSGDLVAQTFNSDGSLGDVAWSAAEQLDLKTYDTRELLTFNDQVTSGQGGIPFRDTSLNALQKEALKDNTVTGTAAFDTQILKHVNYLRGDARQERPQGNLRERPVIKGRIGDIVNSTPVFYGQPDRIRRSSPPYPTTAGETYEEFKAFYTAPVTGTPRRSMVYVGSNGGFLHGFDSTDGEEIFAYMPGLAITGFYSERVKQLLSTNYAHRFTVDLSVAVNDVYMDVDRRANTLGADKDWATVLIGGFRGGAKGYFALDVTDPDAVTEANAANVAMWEFSDVDDIRTLDGDGNTVLDENGQPASDVGYSYSQPTIAMSNAKDLTDPIDDRNNRWISIFGNGYNSSGGRASLFATFLDGGTDGTWCHPDKPAAERCDSLTGGDAGVYDFVKLETPGFNLAVANGMGEPRGIDMDSNGTLDIAYAGDRFGNLYRFDMRNPDPAEWGFTRIFTASYTNTRDSDNITNTAQPVTTQPLVVVHPTIKTGANCGTEFDTDGELIDKTCGGYIIVFGTGSYLYDDDDSSRAVQSVYGIWDRLGDLPVDSTFSVVNDSYSALVKQEYTAIAGDEFAGDGRILSQNLVDYTEKRGWYINFDHASPDGSIDPQYPGEKAVRNVQIRGGIVFVNSIVPKEALSCGVRAGGAANAFCADTGTLECVTEGGVFDVNEDGYVNDSDLTSSGQMIASTYFEDSVPTDSTFIGGSRVTQLSDESLEVRVTNTSGGTNTGRISWQRLKQD